MDSSLMLIPKCEKYIEYMLLVLNKLPRIEKFNIGNEMKTIMYKMFENIIYLSKVDKCYRLKYCNLIDAEISILRCFSRIMYNLKYIDEKKFKYSLKLLDEIGRVLGGYIKSLGVNYAQKS